MCIQAREKKSVLRFPSKASLLFGSIREEYFSSTHQTQTRQSGELLSIAKRLVQLALNVLCLLMMILFLLILTAICSLSLLLQSLATLAVATFLGLKELTLRPLKNIM